MIAYYNLEGPYGEHHRAPSFSFLRYSAGHSLNRDKAVRKARVSDTRSAPPLYPPYQGSTKGARLTHCKTSPSLFQLRATRLDRVPTCLRPDTSSSRERPVRLHIRGCVAILGASEERGNHHAATPRVMENPQNSALECAYSTAPFIDDRL